EPGRAHPVVAAEGVPRLVDALPGAERGVAAERRHDPLEQALARRRAAVRRRGRQVGRVAEPQPAAEAVRRRGVEPGALLLELRAGELEAPLRPARSDEAGAGGGE